jgi:mono/diheme cytochrome c family protein
MHATVIATSEAEYQDWLAGAASSDLGRSEFQGVCATCHGMTGQGGYGPALDTNAIITQPVGLTSIVRNGRGKMPAVGAGWTPEQMQALLVYLRTHIYKGATASGG